MRTRFSIVLILASLAAATLSAQAKPDLSGVWTMVSEKSDFGAMPAPSKMTRTITHKDPSLKMVIAQSSDSGDSTTETSFTTDGKPSHNTVNGSDMTSTASWDGATLVIKSTLAMQDANVGIEDRYVVSDGGKT